MFFKNSQELYMKNIATKVKAIIFDMDGTIIQSNTDIWLNSMLTALTHFGVDESIVQNDKIRIAIETTGLHMNDSVEYLRKKYNIEAGLQNKIKNKILENVHNMNLENLNFINGFEKFHQDLKDAEILSSVATNANTTYFVNIQKRMNLPIFFGEHLYCIDHVNGIGKPNPTLFLYAAEKLKVKPEECLVFEDSFSGFKAAKDAGMMCIAIENEFNQEWLQMTNGSIPCYNSATETIKKILNLQ